MKTLQEYQKILQSNLDVMRYEHSLGVMYTAAALAMRYEADVNRCMIAGLLHDCAKCIPSNEKIAICEANHLPISEVERYNPELLHAKLGAYYMKTLYLVEDETLLDAVVWHSTGRPNMNIYDKIIYVADYIEPHRTKAPDLPMIRRLAFEDIDECLYQILGATLRYLADKEDAIDPMTSRTYEYYKEQRAIMQEV